MNTIFHQANTRGTADFGWLKSQHTFSFGHYYDPKRVGFGLLRVINDDFVAPAKGFDTHPHKNMEIISIPLSGSLKHKDSEGNEAIITHGEVQLMSAGSGVTHSEYNNSESEDVNFLQIWVLPEKIDIDPRYDQQKFSQDARKNQWQTIVSPMDNNDPGVKINQQAWFHLIDLNRDKSIQYEMKNTKNGVYFFMISGEARVGENSLETRDAVGIDGLDKIQVEAKSSSQLLAIEVPLK